MRTTPIEAMLGEVGMKRVEYELDKRVEKWGKRLMRKGQGERFGGEWRKEKEEIGSWRLGWQGRILRGALKNSLEGEKWDFETERGGKMEWKVVIGKGKKEVKREWEKERKRRMGEGLVGVSDASRMEGRIGVGGMLWVYGNRYRRLEEEQGVWNDGDGWRDEWGGRNIG